MPEIDIKLCCDECGNDLEGESRGRGMFPGHGIIDVVPCPVCLKAEIEACQFDREIGFEAGETDDPNAHIDFARFRED